MRQVLGVLRRFCTVTLGAAVRALNVLGCRGVGAHRRTGIGIAPTHAESVGEPCLMGEPGPCHTGRDEPF